MDRKIEILLLKFEQAKKSTWDEIRSFADEWNQTNEINFNNNDPSEIAIYFPNKDHEELKKLEKILDHRHEKHGWEWIKTVTNDPTTAEIKDNDFVQIIGDGYPDAFFLNESEALNQRMTCEKCGTAHPYLREQEEALQVDENFLDHKNIQPNSSYSPQGLDLINMPHGGLLVSEIVRNKLKSMKDLHGYTLLDVLDQHGNISVRLFQLTVDKVILVPDNAADGAFCPACGTVLSTMTEGFAIKKNRLRESSFFSRSSSGISSIYISKALYQVFQSENIRGLTPVQGADLINN